MDFQDTITTGEFARAFGVTRQTVVNWIRDFGIPCSQASSGYRRRIPIEAARNFAIAQGRPIPEALRMQVWPP